MFVCWPKALCECCIAARRPFRKSQIHQNFLQAWRWAFSKKKKNTLRNCLCPRGLRGCDSFCPRRELSDIDGSACKKTPHTYYTPYTRIHIFGRMHAPVHRRTCYPAHMHAHTFPRPVDSSANLLLLFMSISSCCYFYVFSSVCNKSLGARIHIQQ